MTFHPADNLSLTLFSIFCVVMFAVSIFTFKKSKVAKKFFFFYIGFILIVCTLAVSGLAREHVIPIVPVIFITMMILTLALGFSSSGLKVAQTFSLSALVAFHAFRFPLELILHHWADTGTIPNTMTWTGQNFDIFSGLLALVAMPFVSRSRQFAWAFQIVGVGLLINVLRVVILSSPFPFSWSLENPLQLALYFPYVLIAPLFVAPAIFGHIILGRKLRMQNFKKL